MSIKTSSFIKVHYPNTYMEQFCTALHPDLELGPICVSWFRQAVKHCTELITDAKSPSSFFWATVKNFIFPERHTAVLSQKIPISIHPNRLSMQDCQSLLLDIVNDYIQRAPRYSAESTTNVMLWQVLYSLMGIMALGSILLGTIFTYNNYGKPIKKLTPLEELLKPEKRLHAIAKRSLRLAKAEVRQLHVKPTIKPEELFASDGTAILALKVTPKFEFIDSIVSNATQASGRLYRLYDQYRKPKSDFKTQSITRAMKFLDNNSKKLHLLLIFDDDPVFEEGATKKYKSKSPQRKSPQRNSPQRVQKSPSHSPMSRGITLSKKSMLPPVLSGSSSKSLGFGSSSPRSSSPKPVTTPRSNYTATSVIPRNIQKRSPKTPAKSPKKPTEKLCPKKATTKSGIPSSI